MLKDVHTALNFAYSEPFPDDAVASLFTDQNRTAIDPDALTTIRKKIVDLIHAASNTDRITVATIIDQLPLSTYCGKPPRRVPIRGPAGIKSALDQQLASNSNDFVLDLSTAILFIDIDEFNPYTFTGLSLTKFTIAPSINAPTPVTAAAAAAANLLTSQAAAAAAAATVAATTLPLVFDS